jgi:ABC-type multidrug transport system fused ATPase/permease subunit
MLRFLIRPSSVDYATDELIGKTVRGYVLLLWMSAASYFRDTREFAESTILTIAHRLRTVIDYDRVCFSLVGLWPRF